MISHSTEEDGLRKAYSTHGIDEDEPAVFFFLRKI
jgi:hypothetical protein